MPGTDPLLEAKHANLFPPLLSHAENFAAADSVKTVDMTNKSS
jgi:hypothetical protein